ncbi:hypothetical protein JDO7802_03329 [Jannaschia donghaensis]|uniref:Uncharacterized protein n=2 Tax=Jannaschia donghaensis TaxID=420998 RepID=A0A0M6YMX6_9RHOB|nr:hypothetical protein JDO7802_03329 [Jannaschia donghaensis]
MRGLTIATMVCLWASATLADWQLAPQGGWISDRPTARGSAENDAFVLSLTCREGAPFLFTLGYPARAGETREEAFVVEVDGRSFEPFGEHYPPDGLWTATPSADLIAALKAGNVARVAPPDQQPQIIRLRGSSRAIEGALADCALVSASDVPSAADQDAPGEVPYGTTVQFGQLIASTCGGGYSLAVGAEETADLDGDGREDVVLDWAGVTCDDRTKGRGAGFCGAALCRIDVLLTGPGTHQQMMGLKPRFVRRIFDKVALRTTTTGATCGGPTQICEVDWRFDGRKLEATR